ncbi:DDB1- and CUL4-associated factor 15-like isoform X2 [Tubulanus polymorphus]|uniref:DDB1- and CUL4-associated factor 15-like isoform X2 n=1 Tax=Tubulanus polymorphus TaxID=672921 RepID=UPI003DA34D5E
MAHSNPFPKRINQSHNLLTKLTLRETHGCLQSFKRARPLRYFDKIPGRLGFKLSSIASEYVLQDGHVFLGFSKCGTFVVSYSLHVEADEHTAFPLNMYKLHWWHFIPNKSLREVSSVRLFGEQEILHNLYISFSEWPRDKSKVLVFGYSIAEDGEDRRQCFVTITAMPTIAPCQDCQSGITDMESVDLTNPHTKCLRHGYTVHTRFELAPPYPFFTPKTHLKIDGVAVMNTGDSLIAMSVDLDDSFTDKTYLFPSELPQPELDSIYSESTRCSMTETMIANLSGALLDAGSGLLLREKSSNAGDLLRRDAQGRTVLANDENARNANDERNSYFHAPSSNNMPPPSHGLELRCFNSDDQSKSNSRSPADSSHDVYKFTDAASPPMTFGFRAPSDKFYDLLKRDLPSTNFDSTICSTTQSGKENVKENAAVTEHKSSKDQRLLVSTPPMDSCRLGSEISWSPCVIRCEESSTTSSCYSSPLILQNDTQSFTYSVRKYIDSDGPSDAPIDMDDDLSMSYHSVLPLVVHGSNYNPMTVLKQSDSPRDCPTTVLVVKQLTFDIEQYLNEALQSTMDMGLRYVSLADYDAQILDVCADTYCVVGMILVLIRARPPLSTKMNSQAQRHNLKMYQTGFKFEWNLHTGNYTTIETDSYIEVDQKETVKKPWHPGATMCRNIQKQAFVPLSYTQSVHVLTNEAVFKGQSLKTLIDPHHYVAIVL